MLERQGDERWERLLHFLVNPGGPAGTAISSRIRSVLFAAHFIQGGGSVDDGGDDSIENSVAETGGGGNGGVPRVTGEGFAFLLKPRWEQLWTLLGLLVSLHSGR